MNLYYLCATLGVLAAFLIVWAALRVGSKPVTNPETQDDFAPSMARWGYLHDKRDGK